MIYGANLWTGFYMITASVLKELNGQNFTYCIAVTNLSCSNYFLQYTINNALNLLHIVYVFIVTLKFFECLKNMKAKQKTKGA